jgi:hypothetical protein
MTRQWKYLPWLLAGHLVFSIAGFFVYHEFLWVFTKIPYASLANKYGSGSILHYVYQLNYVIGVPLSFLLVAGLISYPWQYLKKRIMLIPEEYLLVVSGLFAYFVAHSIFWYFGIFNSMGLKRVLLGVLPLICLVALRGYNFIIDVIPEKIKLAKLVVGSLLVIYVLVFPFTHNPAAINWKKDMRLNGEQELAVAVARHVKENPVAPGARLLYFYPYLSEALKVDHFDSLRRVDLSLANLGEIKSGDRVIWDNWFAVVEAHVTLDLLLQTQGLVREIDFSSDDGEREVRFVIFRKE